MENHKCDSSQESPLKRRKRYRHHPQKIGSFRLYELTSTRSYPFMNNEAVKEEYLKRICPVTDCNYFVSMSKGQLAVHFASYHSDVPTRFVHRGHLYKLNVDSFNLPGSTCCLYILKIRFNQNLRHPVLWIMCTAFMQNADNEDIPLTCIWLLTEETKESVRAILAYKDSEIECQAYTLEEVPDATKSRNLCGLVLDKEESSEFFCDYDPEITFKIP